MIDRLVEALRGLAPPVTADELADALWLARLLPPGADAAGDVETPGAPPVEQDPPEGAAPPDVPEADREAPPGAAWPGPAQPQAGLRPAPPGSAGPDLVRSPAMPAIPRALQLGRALRPLRVGAASRTRWLLHEQETAQRIAETGVWQPEMRPEVERRLDMALVVDDSVSMVVWQRTVAEFQAVLERLAAFRDVRVWRVDTDDDRLVLRTGTAPGHGSGHSPNELIDPTRRRLVLVVSDCIGRAWRDGRAAGLLERWGAAGPVAIVQPLPQRLWWRCAAAVEPVRITAARAGQPNDRLEVRPRAGGRRPEGIAVPVMELEPRWLRPWAELVGGRARRIDGMALFTGHPTADPPLDGGDDALTPMDRVVRFRAAASPTAYRLACYLAAAPLRIPVMRLVQQAMLPGSRPAHLAEVFLGNLLRKAEAADDPDDVRYEFHDGVRDILLSGLHRSEAMRVLREVWEVLRARRGSTLDFPALLSALEDGPDPSLDPPFAQVAARVLARMGGRYAVVAERLAETSGPGVGWPGPEPGDPAASGPSAVDPGSGPPAAPVTPPIVGPVVGGGLPARNPDFTGRDGLLAATRERLADAVTALLPQARHGLGGEGKSQSAVEYAYRYAGDYDLVWWISAEQITLARSSLAGLARHLGTPLSDDINRTVHHVLQALRSGRRHRRWLLIYDNATDPDELIPLMPVVPGPEGRLATPLRTGHVLVTSRDRRWADRSAAAEVPVFERWESVALLRRRVPGLPVDQADRIADRMADLPLAVEQAAAWHAETGRTTDEYLRLLDRHLAEGPAHDLPEDYPAPLAATLGLAFERLLEETPEAGRLLELWAFFGPEPVPLDLLSAGAGARLPAALRDLLADPRRLRRAMVDIGRYALGRFDAGAASLQVHRLVRAMLQTRLGGDADGRIRDRVHRILAAANPVEPPDDEGTWERRAQLAPHVVPAGVIDGASTAIREVALDQMRYLYLHGDFEGARMLGEIALERWRADLGPDDELALRAGRQLGNVLRALGDVAAAARLNAEIFDRTTERYGRDHVNAMLIANSVGADLRLRGRFTEALDLDTDTMRRMVRMFGKDHVQTLWVANNVGIDLRLLGRFEAAYDIDADALGRLRRQLGSGHRSSLLAMNQLARDLHGLGRYAEAVSLQREALERMQGTLGPDHVFVLHAEMSHAGALRKLGMHDEARRLAEDTLRLHVRRFGEDHPDALAARRALSLACAVTGDAERARRLGESALTGYRRIMGNDHPFVHACAADVALTLRALGGHEAAHVVDDTSLRALGRLLGADHYYTLCCSVGLIHDLFHTGRLEAARSRSRDTLARFRARYGPDHVYTLACAHNHRVIGAALGVDDDPDTLPDLRRSLGAGHPDVRRAAAGGLIECDSEPIPL
ncbi:FxSxx-COOH system tetratricopeptide repeat protein [Thermomonospora umbrina]|uniref:Tetratricopeptide repeat protein n=1 Tax=Thermomonospora umbrina TaxID=111806 RepID=A0A3D9SRB6_9ACTN|nr:FxSxx-COOH system tetratricopeptide repeat protein [Thermomonospora umbrina]REE95485.1 tetratricopeptide repeat protein [Thermomonospora umbrina]